MSLLSIFKSNLLKADKPVITPSAPQAPAAPVATPVAPQPVAPAIPAQDLEAIRAQARSIILEAKDEALRLKDQAIKDAKARLDSIELESRSLVQKQQSLLAQESAIKQSQGEAEAIQKQLLADKDNLQVKTEEVIKKLEKVANLTKEEAKKELITQVEKHAAADIAKTIKDAENQAKEEADDLAREILVDAMRSGATDYVAEYTVSTVSIPDEETKGRIIGKDGRNIRVFEKASGVDVSLDEDPHEVRISCFDSVRREVARVALIRLIKDGRIQPSRIEEYLDKAKRDVEQIMFQEGQRLCHAVGVYNLHHDLISLLGRFKFRTSYGQNMIGHTLEETRIGIKLANEVGADVDIVRLGCLLHDIGKVIEGEGSHVELGVKLLQKYNLPATVLAAVGEHHEDKEFSSTESILVYIADAISGSRPGARHENVEEYGNRIAKIEELAKAHPEVDEAYAIQAGREVRVIVNPNKINDEQLPILASAIRDEIRDNVTFPGTVKVNVIRETRASEIAS